MGLLNINSLTKHIDELRIFVADKPFDVLAINETKLDETISDEQISLAEYSCLRKDRNKHGGGVCLFIRKSITHSRQFKTESENLEMLSIEVKNKNCKPFLITTWYRPPKASDDCFESFENYLKIADSKYKEIYILGDLNCNSLTNNPTSSLEHHTLVI